MTQRNEFDGTVSRFGAAVAGFGLLLTAGGALAQSPQVGPPVRIDTGSGTEAANETTASASDARPGVVIAGWNDWRNSTSFEVINAGFSVTFDNGKTWTDFLIRPPGPQQSGVEGDPMSAFDPRTGTLWAGAISFSSNGSLYVARLDPGETEFNPSVNADLGGGIDKCWMAAGIRPGQPDSTRLYIAYNFGIIWSDNMGDSFTNPTSLGQGIGFLPRVGPNGEVYVSYWNFGSGLLLKRSLNGGASFSTHTIATRMDTWGTQDGSRFPGTFRVPPFATFDVDENTGHLHATYFDTTNIVNGQRNVDLYYTRSTDQGTTWTTPVVINTDNNPPGDQLFAWIECDYAGRLHIVTFDSRHTVQNDGIANGMFDAYYTYSTDGGDSWDEIRLTEQSWNSNNDGLNRSQQFMGDYLGIATSGDHVFPVYLDTSAGDPDTFTRVISFASTAELLGFNVITGSYVGGGINSLKESDDNRLRLQSTFGVSVIEPELSELQVNASLPGAQPDGLSVSIESSIDFPEGLGALRLRNWQTNEFDLVGEYAVGMTDATATIDVANASNYVRNDGRIEVRSRHIVIAPFSALGFQSRYDLVEISPQ